MLHKEIKDGTCLGYRIKPLTSMKKIITKQKKSLKDIT